MCHFMLIYVFYFPVDETSSARSTGQDHGIYLFMCLFFKVWLEFCRGRVEKSQQVSITLMTNVWLVAQFHTTYSRLSYCELEIRSMERATRYLSHCCALFAIVLCLTHRTIIGQQRYKFYYSVILSRNVIDLVAIRFTIYRFLSINQSEIFKVV